MRILIDFYENYILVRILLYSIYLLIYSVNNSKLIMSIILEIYIITYYFITFV